MDLTIRDWMVIIGALLILAVLIDAWRRMRAEKTARVKVRLAPDVGDDSPVDDISKFHELPNGGARVIKRDLIDAQRRNAEAKAEAAREAEEEAAQAVAEAGETASEAPAVEGAEHAEEKEAVDDGLLSGLRSSDDEPENLDWLRDIPLDDETDEDDTDDDDEARLTRAADPEVFMLHVVARDQERGFSGEDILQILLACDLRFGDMDFFHRHEREAGRGPIQFSVANMMQPGVFDIDNMTKLRTPGLLFFLTLPGPEDMMKAFDYMYETAQAVARNLGGDVLDETRSVLTRQTLEHTRQQIRDLERRLLTHAH
jgi:cell division protein ZipA